LGCFKDGVEKLEDLEPGMKMPGIVTNVTAFGAFVDIGVHQDGLVHVSELTHRFVADPREAVKVGEIVKVKVMEVDRERERISLSIKALQTPDANPGRQRTGSASQGRPAPPPPKPKPAAPSVDDLMRKFNRR
jgi:uncharacterized protein